MIFTTLNTAGDGLWSTTAKAVDVTKLDLQYISNDKDFGELCVHFTQDSWNCNTDGLIYSDKQFLSELRVYLQEIGFTEAEANDVCYSEQGMQGDNYVSLDVGGLFIQALEMMDPQHVANVYEECADV